MSRTGAIAITLVALAFAASSCKPKGDSDDKAAATSSDVAPAPPSPAKPESEVEMAEEKADLGYGGKGKRKRKKATGKFADSLSVADEEAPNRATAPGAPMEIGGLTGEGGGGGGKAERGPAPRAWFPETFLFQPLVVTDDAGAAEVSVRVPDRLTAWRVLGLAHSRNGAQAGATTTFQGTLPAYVDPVVPSFLRAGDTVRVPIQLVNNTDGVLSTRLKVEIEGGKLTGSSQAVTIDQRSSTVRFVDIGAERAGVIRLMARMGDSDMVVRTIEVQPTGKPVRRTQSGTLAAPREFSIVGARSRGASQGQARLAVFPGALALLRSELSASIHRGGLASDAFALLLAGKADKLLRSLGDEPDPEALRKLTIMSTQKVMKHARVLDIGSASLIAEAARSHRDNPVLDRLGKRAISTIEASQAPDGTCGGQSGWTLQRLLVSTADCARAAHDSPNVRIRAGGAFERHAEEIADPYTAAAILAAKGASGALKQALEAQVLEAIETSDNGANILVVPDGVLRADGTEPGVVEATALAVLALRDVADAPLPDLGATILASYTPHGGWGDGRANLVCMEAAIELFKDPMPERTEIALSKDGEIVAEGELSRDKVREVLNLGAEGLDISGAHDWRVSARPAVPGLGFSLTLTSWVPWTAENSPASELSIETPDSMKVGEAMLLAVQALAPSAMSFEIKLALPAGVQADASSLDAMVSAGSLQRYELVDGTVVLRVNPLQPAQRFAGTIRVIPTLAGSLQSGPASITVGTVTTHVPPTRWKIQ